jgi:hypothetical protein
MALLTIGETSSHRTWDRLREMYRLTGRYADYSGIQDLRLEIESVLPKPRTAAKGRGSGGRMPV